MKASEVAVLQVLVDEGGVDAPVPASLTLLKDRTGVARSTLQLALAGLAESGNVEVIAAAGRPNLYRVLSTGPTTGPTTRPIDPPDPPDRAPDSTGPIGEIPSRGGAQSSPPPPIPLDGIRGDRAQAHETGPTGPTGPPDRPDPPDDPPDPVVSIGKQVVTWGIDECRRLGKPDFDRSLINRIGTMALAMDKGGVAPVDLKLAVETLVQRDMTDLQAAHRKAQSGVVSARANSSDLDRLAEEAAASRAARDPMYLGALEREHMVEVWWFLAATWGRTYRPAEQQFWCEELSALPVAAILWALRKLSRSGEHLRWPPSPGDVHRLAAPDVRDKRSRREAQERQRRFYEERERQEREEAS